MSIIAEKKTKSKAEQLKIEQCRRYYDQGFSLIPLAPGKKYPDAELLPKSEGKPSWKPLRQKRASWFEIESWLDKKPDINIGIITGKASNLAVIDIDHPKDKDGRQRVKVSDKIDTPTVKTTRYQHIYLRTYKDIGYKSLKAGDHTVGELIADSSHYVVAPPSIHPSGAQYHWEDKKSLIRTELTNFTDITIKTEYITKQSVPQELILILVVPNYELNTQDKVNDSSIIHNQDVNVDSSGRAGKEINKKAGSWWQELTKQPEVAKKVLKLAGVDVKGLELGKAFKCPFHTDESPSAALYMVDENDLFDDVANRYIGFADFHKKGRPKWYNQAKDGNVTIDNGSIQNWFNLAEVYHAIETGKELQKLDPGVGVMWWLRALDDIGEVDNLPSVQARKLPEPDIRGNYFYKQTDDDGKEYEYVVSGKSVQKVYEGFKYLLQLRTIYDDKQAGTPYSYRFAANWCGVSSKTVGKAMRYLMQKGFMFVREETEGQRANILDLNRKELRS